jgi:hypothetical protein
MPTCGDCNCLKDIVNGEGYCKKYCAETHFTPDAPNRVIRRDNSWPKVKVTDTACVDDFEQK